MSEIFNVMRAGGKYTGRDGNERTSWEPCGKLMIKDNGKMSLYLFLTGEWYGIFEPKARDEGPTVKPGSESNSAPDNY